MDRPPPRSAPSGLLVRVLAAERLGLAALGRAGADVLHRLPVVAVVAGLALAGAGVAGRLVGAVVLAGGRDAVALDAGGRLGRCCGLGRRDGAGERAGDGHESGLVHRRPHLSGLPAVREPSLSALTAGWREVTSETARPQVTWRGGTMSGREGDEPAEAAARRDPDNPPLTD